MILFLSNEYIPVYSIQTSPTNTGKSWYLQLSKLYSNHKQANWIDELSIILIKGDVKP